MCVPWKTGQPRRVLPNRGCRLVLRVRFGKRTCKPNSVVCGHSSRRRVAADAHQRPTRRFRHVPEPPGRTGPVRSALMALGVALPSLFGLAPCGVYPASGLTAGAVRSYRTISPLPRHRGNQPRKLSRRSRVALLRNPTYVIAERGSRGGIFSVALAVCGPSSPHPGRYPAHCPAEFGLSSPGGLVAQSRRQRPPGPPARV